MTVGRMLRRAPLGFLTLIRAALAPDPSELDRTRFLRECRRYEQFHHQSDIALYHALLELRAIVDPARPEAIVENRKRVAADVEALIRDHETILELAAPAGTVGQHGLLRTDGRD